ncbi:MAG: hypothetical protein FWH33_07815 [Oscillospiraceae bacterium]|nr:hypothetical protein [Oscillospiraceae bacterium]
MKIEITKTVLYRMPDVAWRMFCLFMTDDDIEHTPMQKSAELYMRYYFAVYYSGHQGFFEEYKDSDINGFIQALADIGSQEFANHLAETAQNGLLDDYDEADAWFYDNEQALIEAIQIYLESNIDTFYEIVDEDYAMRPPKYTFRVGAVMAAIVFALMGIILLTQTIMVYWAFFLMFFAFASPFLILMVYGKIWEVSVKKDVISIRRPFRKKRIIQFSEISDVKWPSGGVIIYARGKKLVVIKNYVSEYRMFCAQLDYEGKIRKIDLTDIEVRQSKVTIFNGLMWPVIAIGALVWATSLRNNPDRMYVVALFAALTLVALWYFFFHFKLKITVMGDVISVQNVLGQEKRCQIHDITKVRRYDRTIAFFANKKKLIVLSTDAEGCSALVERLRSENVPFERTGGIAKATKTKKHEVIVSLEEQLSVLADMDIRPRHDDFIQWVGGEWGREPIESDPYNLLFALLGGERENEDGLWEPLSDDIYNFDTECVENNDIYATVFERLAAISKGGFELSDVSSRVNHRSHKASVSFSFNGTEYSWQLNYNDDWFDIEVIGRINALLKSAGSSKYFYVSNPDQSVTIVFDTDEKIMKLNDIAGAPFGLAISGIE